MALEYKIRNPRTGLYSTGGSRPSWTKSGKTWTGIGHLRNHLGLVDPKIYAGCALVTLEVTVVELPGTSLQSVINEGLAKEAAKKARGEARLKANQERYERSQLDLLKKKYERT